MRDYTEYFPQSCYDKYTPFNVKKETILKEVYIARIIRLPPNARKQQAPLKWIEASDVSFTGIMATPWKIAQF